MSNATKETVIVLDFGGQYNQLIARRVRECNVYCEILPYTVDIQKSKTLAQKVLSSQAVLTAFMTSHHRIILLKFLNSESRFSVFATVVSLWHTRSEAMLFRLRTIHQVSTARQLQDIITMISSLNP